MATFVEIKTENAEESFWALKISNYKDIEEYMRFFAGKSWNAAKVCCDRLTTIGEISHLGENPEAVLLKFLAESEADEKGNYKFKPLEHIGKLVSMKLKLLMQMVSDGHEVMINKNGGCCDIKSFVDIHNASIINEVNKEGIIFPVNIDKSRTYEVVILENDTEISDAVMKIHPGYNYKLLNELRSRTNEEIIFYLSNCKLIITETTFLNKGQVAKFLKLFSKLKDKRMKIITSDHLRLISLLKENEVLQELFEKVKLQNKVLFYSTLLKRIEI